MENTIEAMTQEVISRLRLITDESSGIQKATEIICNAIENDRMVHVLGVGAHSIIAAEEVLWRSGGLAAWNPIIDPGTNLVHGAKKSICFERLPGYGIGVLNAYNVGVEDGEVILIINAYGIGQMCIDVALECKKRGVTTIGISSKEFAQSIDKENPSRHELRYDLQDIVDIHIDSHVPAGDTAIKVENFDNAVGSVSSIANCFIMNVLVATITKTLVVRGIDPPVFINANSPEGMRKNKVWEEKYGPHVRHLL
mgnify:CR=1 FL=1